jgi:ribosome-interacting GTPase 1
MPANLTPDYLAAEREYRDAQTPSEKIAALERMLATLPKHKGTEKLQADIRRRLSQARKDSQKKGAAHAAPFYLVKKEGAGQVALLGPPNSGKSQLLCALTHARPEVADYPFTTRLPAPGMMLFENVQIQLVDLPPVAPEFTEPWLPQVVRYADASLLVAGLDDPDVLDGIEYVLSKVEEWRVPPPGLLVANKSDLSGAGETFTALQDLYSGRFPLLSISAATGAGLDRFARAVFDLLGLVRVYTKAPGKKAELSKPYVLRRGQTVQDAARHVHKDFAEHLKFARLFRTGGGHDGLMVERTHLVEDEDILEFHI